MGPHCLHSWGSQPLTWGHICLPHILAGTQNASHMSPHHPICTKFHYVLTYTSWWPHRHMSCGLHHHTHSLIHIFNKQSLSTYCMPRAIPGDGDTAMTNTDKISAPAELTSWLGKWTVDRSGQQVLKRKLKQGRGWESWAGGTF